jgi:hypothetical protein
MMPGNAFNMAESWETIEYRINTDPIRSRIKLGGEEASRPSI